MQPLRIYRCKYNEMKRCLQHIIFIWNIKIAYNLSVEFNELSNITKARIRTVPATHKSPNTPCDPNSPYPMNNHNPAFCAKHSLCLFTVLTLKCVFFNTQFCFPLFEFYINGITQHMYFWIWFVLLKIIYIYIFLNIFIEV